MNSHLKLILLMILCFPSWGYSFEHWHVSTEKELKSLHIINRKSQPQVLWISGPIKELASDPEQKLELAYHIAAFGNLEIPLIDFQKYPWLHVKTETPGALLVSALTRFDEMVPINPGSSNRWSTRARPNSELILMNLAPFPQKIKVSDLNENPQQQLTIDMQPFGQDRRPLPAWASGRTVLIEGEARIQGFLLNSKGSESFSMTRKPSSLHADPRKVYFRLGNSDDSQSYVVGLSDDSLITQAKDQINQPPGQAGPWLPRILVAEIEYGSGQENRDLKKIGSPLWSWHISKVYNFAQLAHQDCDGSPEMLEELLQVWRQGSRTICFWNYKVLEQISIEQLNQPKPAPLWRRPVPQFLRP